MLGGRPGRDRIRAFLNDPWGGSGGWKKAAGWLPVPGWAAPPPGGWGGVRLKKRPDVEPPAAKNGGNGPLADPPPYPLTTN